MKSKVPICPYCNVPAVKRDSSIIYGRSFGDVYICVNYPQCDTYVGVHKTNGESKGTLANAELREARKESHEWFDMIWKNKQMTRAKAYKWLAEMFDVKEIHIGESDIATCKRITELSQDLLKTLRRGDIDFGVTEEWHKKVEKLYE